MWTSYVFKIFMLIVCWYYVDLFGMLVLYSHSLDIKTKEAEKVKPVDVTPTISSSGSLYLFVL